MADDTAYTVDLTTATDKELELRLGREHRQAAVLGERLNELAARANAAKNRWSATRGEIERRGHHVL